ncbi:sulfatase-like hydrolase/transferase, partial [Akkermansiaceae bacterium]|nr:sulfatase-like hydrolase/transferase [Akkermansiaceae bacterium]
MKKYFSSLFLALSSLLPAQEPNIIVILVDDMGYGDIKAYNPAAKTSTPRLDTLASEGMRFTDFHTNSAVCTPTRYGLLTGRYAWRTRLKSGVLNGSSRRLIDPARDTIPKLLKRKNYRTASVGKWHLGMTNNDGLTNIYQTSTAPDRQLGTNDIGFDEWYGIPASLDHIPYTIVNNGGLINMTDDSPSPSYSTWPNQSASPSPRFIRAGKIAPGFDFEKLMARLGEEDANQNGTIDTGESNPTLRDTDGDGIDDLSEKIFDTDPTDATSFPDLALSSEENCLHLDTFEDNDPATGASPTGGLTLVNNTVASGHSLSETSGQLTINTGSGTSGNVGASTPAIDFAGSPAGIRLTWDIASLTNRPLSNGLFLGISEGTNFFRNEANIGLIFFGKAATGSTSGFSLVLNDSDNPVGPILNNGAELQLASLLDGFSAT